MKKNKKTTKILLTDGDTLLASARLLGETITERATTKHGNMIAALVAQG